MSSQIRSLKSVAWKDPLAWMEQMKGDKWDELIIKEIRTYNSVYRNYVNHQEVNAIEMSLLMH
jgi:hypothetical protein